MTFSERVAAHPWAFAAGCLVWVPIAIWVISMIHWMVQGDIDAGFGFLGIAAGLTLGGMTVFVPNPDIAPYLLIAATSTIVAFPVVRRIANRHALAQLDVEQVERAYEMLDEKPNNLAANLRLARVLYDRGVCGHAIVIAEEALKGVPPTYFQDEARMLRQWKLDTTEPKHFRELPCFRCGALNPPGVIYCSKCASPFLLDYAKGRWLEPSTMHRVVAFWFAAVLLLIAIPLTVSNFDPAISMLLILVEVVVAGTILLLAFRRVAGGHIH